MSDDALAGYTVTFARSPIFGTWTWRAVGPRGRVLAPLMWGMFANKRAAERDALRRIRLDCTSETLSGDALSRRVEDHTVSGT